MSVNPMQLYLAYLKAKQLKAAPGRHKQQLDHEINSIEEKLKRNTETSDKLRSEYEVFNSGLSDQSNTDKTKAAIGSYLRGSEAMTKSAMSNMNVASTLLAAGSVGSTVSNIGKSMLTDQHGFAAHALNNIGSGAGSIMSAGSNLYGLTNTLGMLNPTYAASRLAVKGIMGGINTGSQALGMGALGPAASMFMAPALMSMTMPLLNKGVGKIADYFKEKVATTASGLKIEKINLKYNFAKAEEFISNQPGSFVSRVISENQSLSVYEQASLNVLGMIASYTSPIPVLAAETINNLIRKTNAIGESINRNQDNLSDYNKALTRQAVIEEHSKRIKFGKNAHTFGENLGLAATEASAAMNKWGLATDLIGQIGLVLKGKNIKEEAEKFSLATENKEAKKATIYNKTLGISTDEKLVAAYYGIRQTSNDILTSAKNYEDAMLGLTAANYEANRVAALELATIRVKGFNIEEPIKYETVGESKKIGGSKIFEWMENKIPFFYAASELTKNAFNTVKLINDFLPQEWSIVKGFKNLFGSHKVNRYHDERYNQLATSFDMKTQSSLFERMGDKIADKFNKTLLKVPVFGKVLGQEGRESLEVRRKREYFENIKQLKEEALGELGMKKLDDQALAARYQAREFPAYVDLMVYHLASISTFTKAIMKNTALVARQYGQASVAEMPAYQKRTIDVYTGRMMTQEEIKGRDEALTDIVAEKLAEDAMEQEKTIYRIINAFKGSAKAKEDNKEAFQKNLQAEIEYTKEAELGGIDITNAAARWKAQNKTALEYGAYEAATPDQFLQTNEINLEPNEEAALTHHIMDVNIADITTDKFYSCCDRISKSCSFDKDIIDTTIVDSKSNAPMLPAPDKLESMYVKDLFKSKEYSPMKTDSMTNASKTTYQSNNDFLHVAQHFGVAAFMPNGDQFILNPFKALAQVIVGVGGAIVGKLGRGVTSKIFNTVSKESKATKAPSAPKETESNESVSKESKKTVELNKLQKILLNGAKALGAIGTGISATAHGIRFMKQHGIKETSKLLWQSTKDRAEKLKDKTIEKLNSTITKLTKPIKENIENRIERFKEWRQEKKEQWQVFSHEVSKVMAPMTKVMKSAAEKITKSKWFNSAKDSVSEGLKEAKNAIKKKTDPMINFLKDQFGSLKKTFKTVGENIGSKFKNAFSKFGEKLKDFGSKADDFLSDIPGVGKAWKILKKGGGKLLTGAAGLMSIIGGGSLAAGATIAAGATAAGAVVYGAFKNSNAEAMDLIEQLEKVKAVEYNRFGESKILNWDIISKLSTKQLSLLVDFDDWSDDDLKKLKLLRDRKIQIDSKSDEFYKTVAKTQKQSEDLIKQRTEEHDKKAGFIAKWSHKLASSASYMLLGRGLFNHFTQTAEARDLINRLDNAGVIDRSDIIGTDTTIKDWQTVMRLPLKDMKLLAEAHLSDEDKKRLEKLIAERRTQDVVHGLGPKFKDKKDRDNSLKNISDNKNLAFKTVKHVGNFFHKLNFLNNTPKDADQLIIELDTAGIIDRANFAWTHSEVKDWETLGHLTTEDLEKILKYGNFSDKDKSILEKIIKHRKAIKKNHGKPTMEKLNKTNVSEVAKQVKKEKEARDKAFAKSTFTSTDQLQKWAKKHQTTLNKVGTTAGNIISKILPESAIHKYSKTAMEILVPLDQAGAIDLAQTNLPHEHTVIKDWGIIRALSPAMMQMLIDEGNLRDEDKKALKNLIVKKKTALKKYAPKTFEIDKELAHKNTVKLAAEKAMTTAENIKKQAISKSKDLYENRDKYAEQIKEYEAKLSGSLGLTPEQRKELEHKLEITKKNYSETVNQIKSGAKAIKNTETVANISRTIGQAKDITVDKVEDVKKRIAMYKEKMEDKTLSPEQREYFRKRYENAKNQLTALVSQAPDKAKQMYHEHVGSIELNRRKNDFSNFHNKKIDLDAQNKVADENLEVIKKASNNIKKEESSAELLKTTNELLKALIQISSTSVDVQVKSAEHIGKAIAHSSSQPESKAISIPE